MTRHVPTSAVSSPGRHLEVPPRTKPFLQRHRRLHPRLGDNLEPKPRPSLRRLIGTHLSFPLPAPAAFPPPAPEAWRGLVATTLPLPHREIHDREHVTSPKAIAL